MNKNSMLYMLLFLPLLTEGMGGDWQPRAVASALAMTLLAGIIVWILLRTQKQLTPSSKTDGLTGLKNRREFQADLLFEVRRADQMHTHLALAFIHVDRFQDIRDRWGHRKGDLVLKELAHSILFAARKDCDSCYRMEGGEFAILVPYKEKSEEGGIKRRFEQLVKTGTRALWAVDSGLSLGLVHLQMRESAEALLRRADKLMDANRTRNQLLEERQKIGEELWRKETRSQIV